MSEEQIKVVKCGDEIVGYVTTEQGHEALVDSVIKDILTPADYKRYKESMP